VDSEFSATLRLDPRIYSREAILRACYWCTSVAHVVCPESSDNSIVVRVQLKQTTPTLDNPRLNKIEEFLGEFCNSLLDFELRRQVEAETSSIRQLVLAKAFSESGVLEDDPPGTVADPVETDNAKSLVQIKDTRDAGN
jgi:His-Xaa-Ser system protein HxsD